MKNSVNFSFMTYTHSLNTLILKELLTRGYENTKVNLGLEYIDVYTFDEIHQKYFAFKIDKGTYTYHHPNDSIRAVYSIVDVLQSMITVDKTFEICVCKVELVKPYNLFSEAVKGLVRYRVVT